MPYISCILHIVLLNLLFTFLTGCQPIALYLLSRHGSHNPEADEINELQGLRDLKNNILTNYNKGNFRNTNVSNLGMIEIKIKKLIFWWFRPFQELRNVTLMTFISRWQNVLLWSSKNCKSLPLHPRLRVTTRGAAIKKNRQSQAKRPTIFLFIYTDKCV